MNYILTGCVSSMSIQFKFQYNSLEMQWREYAIIDLVLYRLIDFYHTLQVAPLISHRNDAVAREALSFLKTLLFSGNRNVQKGFELFSRSREDKIILTFKSRLEFAINRYEER